MESKHTPTPWIQHENEHVQNIAIGNLQEGGQVFDVAFWIDTWDGDAGERTDRKAQVFVREKALANAAFTVRAVNLHGELVQMVKDLAYGVDRETGEEFCDECQTQKDEPHNKPCSIGELLEKAEGREPSHV